MKVIDKIGNIITYILIFLITIIIIFMTYSYISLNLLKKDYVNNLLESLKQGDNKALKSRRNKKAAASASCICRNAAYC